MVLVGIGHNAGDVFYGTNFHVYVCGQITIQYNRKWLVITLNVGKVFMLIKHKLQVVACNIF